MSIATIKRDLLNSLKDREFRAAFNLESVYTTICFQLRALREEREMSQGALGRTIKPRMAQERISILEDPNANSKPTLKTLLRLAEGLDVGLDVRFVPFSTVLERSTHTDMRELQVASFEDELPVLEQAIANEIALENRANAAARVDLSRKYVAGINQGQSRWPENVSRTMQQRGQPSFEGNFILIQGGLANAARFRPTG